jgi:hypothetical protein
MKYLWVSAEFDEPAVTLWQLLVDPDEWPLWGPSVRRAVFDNDVLELGTRGTVTTALGVTLPFQISGFDPGRQWSWTVGGIPASDHRVEPIGLRQCRVSFGVPWPTAPYLAICRAALRRLDRLVNDRNTLT